MNRRRALMGAKSGIKLLYSLYNKSVTAGESIDTNLNIFDGQTDVTILIDYQNTSNPTSSSSDGRTCKLLWFQGIISAGTNGRVFNLGKYSGSSPSYSVWWFNENAASHTLDDGASAASRKRFAVRHNTNSGTITVWEKIGSNAIKTHTFTATFINQNRTLCIGHGTDTAQGLAPGTIHSCEVYNGILSDEDVTDYLNNGRTV